MTGVKVLVLGADGFIGRHLAFHLRSQGIEVIAHARNPARLAKWLHILSSTVLFGTGIGTAFQLVWTMRTGRVETIHSVASGVVVADWIFTTPAGIVQPLTGLWLVHLTGHSLTAAWLVATYALYLLAFCCWIPVLRLQIRLRDLAADALASGQPLPLAARQAYRIWFLLGWPAFAALVAVFWLMVTKPDF